MYYPRSFAKFIFHNVRLRLSRKRSFLEQQLGLFTELRGKRRKAKFREGQNGEIHLPN